MDQNRQRERRWIILGKDGRFITFGRAVTPIEEEIAEAEAAMRAQGVAGWIAVMTAIPGPSPDPVIPPDRDPF